MAMGARQIPIRGNTEQLDPGGHHIWGDLDIPDNSSTGSYAESVEPGAPIEASVPSFSQLTPMRVKPKAIRAALQDVVFHPSSESSNESAAGTGWRAAGCSDDISAQQTESPHDEGGSQSAEPQGGGLSVRNCIIWVSAGLALGTGSQAAVAKDRVAHFATVVSQVAETTKRRSNRSRPKRKADRNSLSRKCGGLSARNCIIWVSAGLALGTGSQAAV
eukprot:CAMPEP_0117494614 /NCGR_PEP_ID=MMETSP0784-20121206/19702_1 /TAXON_ID=39447 /ORGANISM="" /LENGTH=217 /DNA_ID=CAMNT_0005289499 /DNA_START=53 /DNA_END=703 /DNA_ORIENTATION=+